MTTRDDIYMVLTDLAEDATDSQIRAVPGLAQAVATALREAADEDERDCLQSWREWNHENPDDQCTLAEFRADNPGWQWEAQRARADRLEG